MSHDIHIIEEHKTINGKPVFHLHKIVDLESLGKDFPTLKAARAVEDSSASDGAR